MKFKIQAWIAHRQADSGEFYFLILKTFPRNFGTGLPLSIWQPVTGSVESGESLEQGCLREVEEETGIRFRGSLVELGRFEYQRKKEWDTDWVTVQEVVYLLWLSDQHKSPFPSVHLDGKEHEAFDWSNLTESLKRVYFDSNRDYLRLAFKWLEANGSS